MGDTQRRKATYKISKEKQSILVAKYCKLDPSGDENPSSFFPSLSTYFTY